MRDRKIDRQFERFRRTGDVSALAAVFDATAPELHRVAVYLAGDRDLADDAVQETFVTAIEAASTHDGARGVMPWLLGILAHRARTLRRRRQRAIDPDRLAQGVAASAADEAAGRELDASLDAALSRLETPYREVVMLHVRQGMTAREIGEVLGRPAGTVRTQVVRGMEILRRLLPAGFAASAMLTAAQAAGGVAPRVRASVLARAAELTPAHAAAAATGTGLLAVVGWLGGMMTTKWIAGGLVAAGLVAALWTAGMFDAPSTNSTPVEPPAVAPRVSAVPVKAAELPPAAAPRHEVPAAAESVLPASVDFEFVWVEDGAPATHLQFVVQRRELGSLDGFATHAHWNTGDVGRVAAADLPSGEYLLVWTGAMVGFELVGGQSLVRRVELQPPARIDGRVIDRAGDPVAAAEIWVADFADFEHGAPRRVASSGPDGRFVLRDDRFDSVWATVDGVVASERPVLAGERESVVLQLGAAGRRMQGVVVDDQGRAVSGATVLVVARGAGVHGTTARPAPLVFTTDRDGRFASDRLAHVEYLVIARAAGHPIGHASFAAEPDDGEVRVVLTRPVSITGIVRRGSEPTTAWLIAQPAWLDAVPAVQNLFVARAEAGADGRYTLALLTQGKTKVICSVVGAPPVVRDFDLLADEVVRWDPVVGAPAEVRGILVDRTGTPLGGWFLWARTDAGSARSETFEDGTFQIQTTVGAGAVTLWARPREAGGDGWTDEISVAVGAQDVRLTARVTPADAGRLVGRVVDADGELVPWAELIAHTVRPGVYGQGLQERVSQFSVPMMPGRYALSVRYADGRGVDLGQHDVPLGATVDLGEIRPPELGRFVIRLRGSDGRLHEPKILSLTGAGGHAADLEVLDDGARRTPPLGAGRFTVWARGETFAASFQNFELMPGPDTVVEMRVDAATPVRFVVPRPAGFSDDWSVAATWRVRDVAGQSVPIGSPLPLSGGEEATLTFGFVPGRYEYEVSIDDHRAAGTFDVSVPVRSEPVVVRLVW